MIKTNHGIIVKPRMNGNEKSIPMPKSIPIDLNSNYMIQIKNNKIQIEKLQTHKNIFDDPKWNVNNVRSNLKKHGLAGIHRPMGREL